MNRYFAFIAALVAVALPARADIVQDKVNQFFAQGFTHFQVERGTARTKIKGYSSTGQKVEVTVSNATGETLSQYFDVVNEAKSQDRIGEIEQRHEAETHDDGRENHERDMTEHSNEREDNDGDRRDPSDIAGGENAVSGRYSSSHDDDDQSDAGLNGESIGRDDSIEGGFGGPDDGLDDDGGSDGGFDDDGHDDNGLDDHD